jgi:hypothetical protein
MSAIMGKDPEEAWSMLSSLVDARDSSTNVSLEFRGRSELIHVPEHIKAVTFSDTVFLFTLGDTEADLRALTIVVGQMFSNSIYNRVPIRVGVAKGDLFVNFERSMYAGPALIEAYHVGESSQWLGATFAPSVADDVAALGLVAGEPGVQASNVVVPWPVPMKNSIENMMVLNWPALMAHQLKIDPPFTAEVFYEIFEPTFGCFAELPQDVRVKYENTVAFFNVQHAAHVA